MSTISYVGNAQAIAQVREWVFAGTWEATDVVTATINGKSVSISAGSTTISDILDDLVVALNLSDVPEFAEVTWSAASPNLVGTADTAGVPFDCELSTTEAGGGSADAQTIDGSDTSTGTDTTASSGPYDASIAANYSGGALPSNGDTLILSGAVQLLYGLDALSGVTLASRTADATFTGNVGLPELNPAGYVEYRPRFWSVAATLDNIYSTGGRYYIDSGSAQTTLRIFGSASPTEPGRKTIQWKNTHVSSAVYITKGYFAAGPEETDSYKIATLDIGYQTNQASDCNVYLGPGGTLTTLYKTGGSLEINSAFTTLNHYAGETLVSRGTTGTANVFGGRLRDRNGSTKTQVYIYDSATYDLSPGVEACTITNLTMYGGELIDPGKRATFSNPIAIKSSKVKLTLGTDYTLQRA